MSTIRSNSLLALTVFSVFLCLSGTISKAQAIDTPKTAQDYFALGVAADRPNGDLTVAVKAYREAIKLDAKYLDAHMRLGIALMRLRQFTEAVSAFQTAASLRPDLAPIHVYLAQARLATGDDFAALDEIKEAQRLDPQVDGGDAVLGSIYAKLGRFDDAQVAMARALQRRESDPNLHFQLGLISVRRTSWEQAINSFLRVIALSPDFPGVHGLLAHAYGQAGHSVEALAEYREVIRRDPKDWAAYFEMGRLLVETGDRESGLASYVRSYELQATPAAALNIGELLEVNGDHKRALPYLRVAVQGMPQERAAHASLANALASLGRFDEATPSLQRLVALQPEDPHALAQLGNNFMSGGHLDEAITALTEAARLKPTDAGIQELFRVAKARKVLASYLPTYERAVAANPKDPDAHIQLARKLSALRRFAEAEVEYLEAIRLDPDNGEYENSLAVSYSESAQPAKAIPYYQRAAVHHPHHVIYYSLGGAYEQLGKIDEAIAAYRKAVEMSPKFSFALYRLGVIYSDLSRWPESIEILQQALQADPTDVFALNELGKTYYRSGDKTAAMQQYYILKNLDANKAADLLKVISR